MKRALVCGAGGFIGSHLVKRLKREGFWVRGVDLKYPRFSETEADDFILAICGIQRPARASIVASTRSTSSPPTWAGPATSSPARTTPTSCTIRRTINLNMLEAVPAAATASGSSTRRRRASTPSTTRRDPDNPNCAEDSAYPAAPDSEYGWEKLFSERLYMA